jgi:regulator of telomere elongation helicase 1
MPASIVCPKCDREYTIEEYEVDKFCKDCDTLLSVGAGASTRTWKDLFPYEPYQPQLEFIEDVIETVAKGGVLIAEACNGFGKTISSLSCLLPTGKQIVYATRTHEQVRQVLIELDTINKKAGRKYTAVNLASRDFLCVNQDCKALPSNEATEMCHILRKSGECPYTHEIDQPPSKLPAILGRKELVDEGKRRKICPYFLARRMAKESKVIVAPYPYIFNPMIRMMTGLDLEKKILILDEGHNIDQVGQDILSDTLTERNLSAAIEEMKLIGKSPRYLNRLGEHLMRTITDNPKLMQPRKLQDDFEKALKVGIDTFIDGHAILVDTIRAKKLQDGNTPISYLNGILEYFELLQTSQKDKYVGLYTKNYFGAPVIEYRCLDPSLAVEPIVQLANGVLIMSGTLSPIGTFAEIIGQQSAKQVVYDPIQKSDKIKMIIDTGVSTAYKERTDQMSSKIGRALESDLKNVNSGALIFFTQRGYMSRCIEMWTKQGIIKTRNGLTYFGGKRFFREGRDARQNREIVMTYKKAAVSGGAVLLCVFRGRNSEGSNFPGDQARGIFLVGVPYANYGNPLVKAQIQYFDRAKRGLGNKWYTMDAFRAANQSLGRGIRGKDDWCHYFLFDRRYYGQRNLISKWAKGDGITRRISQNRKQSSFKKFSDDTIIE